MRSIARALVAILLIVCFGNGANAQTDGTALKAGIGVICNSAEQIERFLTLINKDDGSTAEAIQTINIEVEDPTACGIAPVAFFPEKLIRTLTMSNQAIKVMRIRIVGTLTERGWVQIDEVVQFSAVIEKSEEA